MAGGRRTGAASSGDAFAELAAALSDEPPASLRDAAPAAIATLAAAVRQAHEHQEAELVAATDRAFEHIPRLLRGPVKRLLGDR